MMKEIKSVKRYPSLLVAGTAIAATLTIADAADAFTLYKNRDAWQKAVSNITTETFDSATSQVLAFPDATTSPSGVRLTANGRIEFFNPIGNVGEVRPGTGAFSGGNEFSTSLKYDNYLSIVFPQTVRGFGFDYKGLTIDFNGRFAETAEIIGAFGFGPLASISLPQTDFPDDPNNDPETVAFLGIVTDVPMRQILLYGESSRLGEANFEIDNLSFASDVNNAIPTPALLPSLIGMAIAALRQSKSNSEPVEGDEG
jgi:hypothetical protein